MVTTPSKYKGKEGKSCNCFLPSLMEDSHKLCVTCRGQYCSLDLECDHCASWTVDNWSRVQAYFEELQRQLEGKSQVFIFSGV